MTGQSKRNCFDLSYFLKTFEAQPIERSSTPASLLEWRGYRGNAPETPGFLGSAC